MLEKVLYLAEMQIGTAEQPPRSNSTIFGEAYGANGVPWCVIFIWWLFCMLKLARLFYGGKRCASCSQLLEWAKETGQTVKPSEAQRGDVLFFNFDGGSTPEHCGMLRSRVVEKGREVFYSIEGNTPLPKVDNDGVLESHAICQTSWECGGPSTTMPQTTTDDGVTRSSGRPWRTGP